MIINISLLLFQIHNIDHENGTVASKISELFQILMLGNHGRKPRLFQILGINFICGNKGKVKQFQLEYVFFPSLHLTDG